MEKAILSIEELTELLNTEEYKYIAPEKEYLREFETHNTWTSPEVLNLWDTLMEDIGQPATPKEFLERGLIMTKNFWYDKSPDGRLPKYTMTNGSWVTTYLQWNETMERAVKWRLSRMYESYLFEYSAMSIIHTDFPDVTLVGSNEIDLVLGVDLVTINKETKKIAYIHITKDSQWSQRNIINKGGKTTYLKSRTGKKHYWHRRLNDSHLVLLYNLFESETSTNMNGHNIFKREYVGSMLADKFEESIEKVTEKNELKDFHAYLVNNKLIKGGIQRMIIKYTFGN